MNTTLVKGYVLTIVSGLLIAAAAVLVVLQWGNAANFSLYGKNIANANTALLMLASAAGGITMVWLAKMLLAGIRALRKGRSAQRQQQLDRRLAELEKRPQDQA